VDLKRKPKYKKKKKHAKNIRKTIKSKKIQITNSLRFKVKRLKN
jgi:hypothetical protein